jgi:hypothetical protein
MKKSFGLPFAVLLLTCLGGILPGAAQSAASCLRGDWRTTAPVQLAVQKTLPDGAVDEGAAPAEMQLDRVLLLLSLPADRQQALTTRLSALQDPQSALYHQWMTPAAFAAEFGNSTQDVAAVAAWLSSQGVQVASLPNGLGWIEFSGSAAQLHQIFGAQVELVSFHGATRAFLMGTIAVPAAFQQLIAGVVSLDGTLSGAAATTPVAVSTALATLAKSNSVASSEALTPNLAGTLLQWKSIQAKNTLGSGESIAIAARSSVHAEDFNAFRAAFGLPAATLAIQPNGADPGITADEPGVAMAAQWAGAAAPGAQILVVPAASTTATDGVDLSLAAIVDQKLADVLAVGYSLCETSLSAAHQGFYAALYRQAAAEGITVVAAAGDSGAAGCAAAGLAGSIESGYAVNALASTPWNTAVGTAGFSDASRSALSAWAPANAAEVDLASGGGSSQLYDLPVWQQGVTPASMAKLTTAARATAQSSYKSSLTAHGGSAAEASAAALSSGFRLVPDLALPTASDAAVNPGLAYCLGGSDSCTLVRGGGSAASAAIFAGVAALINQSHGTQGNLNASLYSLSSRSGVYSDVALGSAQLNCVSGSTGCGNAGKIGFTAGPGYDLTSGLGSVNVTSLVESIDEPSNTAAIASSVTWSTSAQRVLSGTNLTLTAVVASGDTTVSSVPVGTVSFIDTSAGNAVLGTAAVQASGQASVTVSAGSQLLSGASAVLATGMTHNIQAVFTSSATAATIFASATSASLAIFTPANSSIVWVNTTTPQTIDATQSLTLAVKVASADATVTSMPTGTVSFDDLSNSTTPLLSTVTLTAAGTAQLTIAAGGLTTGTHIIQATYNGSSVYGTATTTTTITIVVTAKINTTIVLTENTSTVSPEGTVVFTATVTPDAQSTSEAYPTGTVDFYNGTTLIGSATLYEVGSSDVSVATLSVSNSSALPVGNDTVTAQYLGDKYYEASTSNPVVVDVQDFSITADASNATILQIVKGGSGAATYDISALGGFAGQIQVTCSVPAADYMSCTATPQQLTPPGKITFVVSTYTTGGQSSWRNRPVWQRVAGGTALAMLGFFLLPFGSRVRRFVSRTAGERGRRLLILVLLLTGVSLTGAGCSSNSASGNAASGNGTPLGQTSLAITAVAYVNTTVVSHTVYLNVNVVSGN